MSDIGLIIAILSIILSLFVVLTERKFLAFAQRRIGPTVFGRNGTFQIILDLLKLLSKDTYLNSKTTTYLAPFFLVLLYATQLVFTQFFIFGNSLFMFSNVDSLVLYFLIFTLLSNIFLVLVGFISQSKYAMIGTLRAIIHIISLDIFITIAYTILIFTNQSVNFHDFNILQNSY